MKKLIFGLVAGLLIGTAGTAFAATNSAVQAVFAKFSFVVNGQPQTLESDPLVYNGTTYLPVRVVSRLLDYDVNFQADTRTIELSGPTGGPTSAGESAQVGFDGGASLDGEHQIGDWIGNDEWIYGRLELGFDQWTSFTSDEHPGLEIVVGPSGILSANPIATGGAQDIASGGEYIDYGTLGELRAASGEGTLDLAEFTFLIALDLRTTPVFIGYKTAGASDAGE